MPSPVSSNVPDVEPHRDAAQAAARRLESRGRCLRWDVSDACGVVDVRLVVQAGAVCVEVLVPGPDGAWWDAVRVTSGSRQVWRGPQVACPSDHLVRFVEDLLDGDDQQLAGRYRLLG